MNALSLVIGLLLLISLLIFLIYAAMAVRHATHFRYLSKRMLMLTLLFIASSIVLIGLLFISYGFFILR